MCKTLQAIVILSAVFLLGTAEADARCRFSYSDNVRVNIVDMQMIGKQLHPSAWNDHDPMIILKGDTVELAFLPKEPDDGSTLLDPPYFVVLIEGCGRGEVRSGFVAWDVLAGVRKPLPGEDQQPGYLH